jgi:hypothetical protein
MSPTKARRSASPLLPPKARQVPTEQQQQQQQQRTQPTSLPQSPSDRPADTPPVVSDPDSPFCADVAVARHKAGDSSTPVRTGAHSNSNSGGAGQQQSPSSLMSPLAAAVAGARFESHNAHNSPAKPRSSSSPAQALQSSPARVAHVGGNTAPSSPLSVKARAVIHASPVKSPSAGHGPNGTNTQHRHTTLLVPPSPSRVLRGPPGGVASGTSNTGRPPLAPPAPHTTLLCPSPAKSPKRSSSFLGGAGACGRTINYLESPAEGPGIAGIASSPPGVLQLQPSGRPSGGSLRAMSAPSPSPLKRGTRSLSPTQEPALSADELLSSSPEECEKGYEKGYGSVRKGMGWWDDEGDLRAAKVRRIEDSSPMAVRGGGSLHGPSGNTGLGQYESGGVTYRHASPVPGHFQGGLAVYGRHAAGGVWGPTQPPGSNSNGRLHPHQLLMQQQQHQGSSGRGSRLQLLAGQPGQQGAYTSGTTTTHHHQQQYVTYQQRAAAGITGGPISRPFISTGPGSSTPQLGGVPVLRPATQYIAGMGPTGMRHASSGGCSSYAPASSAGGSVRGRQFSPAGAPLYATGGARYGATAGTAGQHYTGTAPAGPAGEEDAPLPDEGVVLNLVRHTPIAFKKRIMAMHGGTAMPWDRPEPEVRARQAYLNTRLAEAWFGTRAPWARLNMQVRSSGKIWLHNIDPTMLLCRDQAPLGACMELYPTGLH